MQESHPSEGYIFIVTYGRSGSTVLQSMLQSIDGYFIRGENHNILLSLFQAYKRAHKARYEHGKEALDANQPWYGADEIVPTDFAQSLKDVFVRDILQPPAGARVIGFKEIRFHECGEESFSQYLDFIRDSFAPARFIFNMRGWEAVSQSSWWRNMNPDRVREIVEGCDSLYEAYRAANPDICHIMRYEDFQGNPEGFRGLFEFLSEPFDPKVAEAIVGTRLDHAKDL